MKKESFRCALLALALAAPLAAQPPTPGPEHQRLGFWSGDWAYEIPARGASPGATGTFAAKPFGAGFFVRYEETWKPASGNALDILGIIGYDSEQKVYLWHRYWSNGHVDMARGWLRGSTWTFDFGESRIDGKLQRALVVMTEESADRLAFRWQRSVEGQPWEVTSEGRAKKVK